MFFCSNVSGLGTALSAELRSCAKDGDNGDKDGRAAWRCCGKESARELSFLLPAFTIFGDVCRGSALVQKKLTRQPSRLSEAHI